jgi:3-phosphoshikimate 1-carboxyvinyltransferase
MKLKIAPADGMKLSGSLRVPSDKSITQRALILALLAEGTSRLVRPLRAGDTRSVERAIARLGARVIESADALEVTGARVVEIDDQLPLDLENSGTGARLLLGALAGRGAGAEITGDASLRSRPMGRVVRPLQKMGASFTGPDLEKLPLHVRATLPLQPYVGELEVASAQAKSAVLLAALGAAGETRVHEPRPTRAHTETLLAQFGAAVEVGGRGDGVEIVLRGPQALKAATVVVPADPSAAAFHAAAAAARPGSRVEFPELVLDPRRSAFFDVLGEMGAKVERRDVVRRDGETIGTLLVEGAGLRGAEIRPERVPDLIDELPLVAVLGALARGPTRVQGAAELRVKESDRIHALGDGLARMGARVWLESDGFVIEGGRDLKGATVRSHGDHRIALALAVAALGARGETTIEGFECAEVSYPGFLEDLGALLQARPFAAIA